MANPTIRIDERYNGFPGMALGGFTGGLLAGRIGPAVEVAFRRPIRTGEALEVVETVDGVQLVADGETAAAASAAEIDIEAPRQVPYDRAEVASRSYPGRHDHPYPSCFTCGTDRAEGDGLRIFPGPVDGGPLLAAPWTPHPNHAAPDGTVPPEFVWAAVDCPSIWAVMEQAAPDSADHVVTGRLAVRAEEPIRAGQPHVVVTWPFERQSGRWPAGAAIFDEAGAVCAVAYHTLVVTDWGVPLGAARPGDS